MFSVAHTDPYFTVDGVSLSLSGVYVERERLTSSFSQFTTKTYSTGFSFGYPLSENQCVNFGLTYSHEDLATVFSSSTQLRDWVRNNGDDYFRRVGREPVLGTILDVVEFNIGWGYDSRDRTLFPTRGGSHRLSFSRHAAGHLGGLRHRELPVAAVLPHPAAVDRPHADHDVHRPGLGQGVR